METPTQANYMPAPVQPSAPSLVDSLKKDFTELSGELWGKKVYIAKAALAALVFLAMEVAFQKFFLGVSDFSVALLRGAALGGATLIGLAICMGPIAYLMPQWNFVEYRRTVGVSGFLLVYLHVMTVVSVYFGGNAAAIYFELNPFKNPIIFGSAAMLLFTLLLLTSTDWAVSKLGFRNWKTVHRLIYPAFVLSVLHFVQINPPLLYNPAGYLLLAATVAAMALQLFGYYKKVSSGKAGAGTWVGITLTLAAVVLFATAFFFKRAVGA